MPSKEEIELETYKQACMYLLYDKENETTLRTAFAALAQERHTHFHTKKNKKDVESASDFADCSNNVCQAALKVLQESREPALELTPLSTELLQDFGMKISRTQSICRLQLYNKSKIEEAPLQQESVKLKV